MHSFSFLYNENTVISKEYPGPLDFDITGVDCIYMTLLKVSYDSKSACLFTYNTLETKSLDSF